MRTNLENRATVAVIASALAASPTHCADAIVDKLARVAPQITVVRMQSTPADGIFQVEIEEDNAPVYVTVDGTHLLTGDLYSLAEDGIENLTETWREGRRRTLLSELRMEDMIVFSPAHNAPVVVYVFTDVDCPYCRMLHGDIRALNGYGIEVRYLAFPRYGDDSPTYARMVSVWCADDSRRALDEIKAGNAIPEQTCDNPVFKQFQLGQELDIEGTPTLVTGAGKLLRGYQPPEAIAETLGLLK